MNNTHFPVTLYLLSTLILSTVCVNALASDTQPSHISIGAFKNKLSTALQKTEQQGVMSAQQQRLAPFIGKSRAEVAKLTSSVSKSKGLQSLSSKHYVIMPDFTIFQAISYLQDDEDFDGYYKTFSVSFDADLYSYGYYQFAEVYALLYVSHNGGDWLLYHTTDNFVIEGQTDSDEYEVVTTLVSGYSPGEYDVLIDLYQVDYNGIVASYSADDSNALYGLPLESENFDVPYNEVIEIGAGGSDVVFALLLLVPLLSRRLMQ